MIRLTSKVVARFFGLGVLGLLALGCNDDAFCFTCGKDDDSPGANHGEGGEGSGHEYRPGNPHTNPDGWDIGEFDPSCGDTTTLEHCGECGNSCVRQGAFASCEEQDDGKYACAYTCAEGLRDLNQDLEGDDSDGCEYACVETSDGEEICDGLDNDCNGEIDDGTDTDNDPQNCGACGVKCAFANATTACDAGICVLEECRSGFNDADRDETTGCEYQCTPTNGGDEICDLLDNDCDHEVDDVASESLDTDLYHCGTCFNSCFGQFENATAACVAGECTIEQCEPGYSDPDGEPENGCESACGFECKFPFANSRCDDTGLCELTECFENFHDLNGLQIPDVDGCEYYCEVTNGGVEICDHLDNDCNGQADDGVNTETDWHHCGQCGFSCEGVFANSAPLCVDSQCQIDCESGYFDHDADGDDPEGNGCEFSCYDCAYPNAHADLDHCVAEGECRRGECFEDYYDLDGQDGNGCEYQCQLSAAAQDAAKTESETVCNELDDDCDGDTDEGFDLLTDADNCGKCGLSCAQFFLHAVGVCDEGTCERGACETGFVDLDGNDQNGCECQVLGAEACNGLDDDCDGVVDDDVELPAETCTEYQVASCGGTPACIGGTALCNVQARAEICDGLDNDCDGQTDEHSEAEPLPGVGLVCGSVSQIGSCHLGRQVCSDGSLVCQGVVGPASESCNGQDDDCDGQVDEELGEIPTACSEYQTTRCGGATSCVNGVPTCHFEASREVCDGADNDCDEVVDETSPEDPLPGLGQLCGTAPQIGACHLGTYTACAEGILVCTGEQGPGTEVCNALDDDCDGEVDEGLGEIPTACSEYQTTQCGGTTSCVSGVPTCHFEASREVCDGVDNDCDEAVDETSPEDPLPGLGQLCGDAPQIGACHLGTYTACAAGILVCTGEQGPGTEACNGLDDDCDGEVDEDLASIPDACSDYQTAQCSGTTSCVNGVPTCQYEVGTETCDGVDNDCDEEIDENPPGEPLPGLGQLCGTVPQVGTCQLGTYTECAGGELVCTGEQGPGTESCNGLDDDCDGEVDEELSVIPNACTAYQTNSCSGTTTCVNGSPTCNYEVSLETCDGADNDCDGDTDESPPGEPLPGLGQLCGTVPQVGTCQLGTYTECAGGELVCTGEQGPGSESCNGLDDDCDGEVDEELTNIPTACTQYQNDSCNGTTVCVNGTRTCSYEVNPESCDGADNDCDGETDESPPGEPLPGLGQLCGTAPQVGACHLGTYTACTAGELVCTGEQGPGTESCNGLDDDCDGEVDDDLTSIPTACTAYQDASCAATTICVNGVRTCSFEVLPEFCDDTDNDCDGETDESPPGEPLPGIGQLCGTVEEIGQCHLGTFTDCESGELVCTGEQGPVTESCNGLDDDCDRSVDEGLGAIPTACTAYQNTNCGATTVCINGVRTCSYESIPEICDGEDNDCDGTADNGSLPEIGQPCGTAPALGRCRLGTWSACEDGELVCTGEVTPTDELCNGEDDDCDGEIDEEPFSAADEHGTGEPCPPAGFTLAASYPGICEGGQWECFQFYSSGSLTAEWRCEGTVERETEVCDRNLDATSDDEDCDTDTNEGCFEPSDLFRLDTGGGSVTESDVGEHHTFQLAVASAGETYFAAYADRRMATGDAAEPEIFARLSLDGGLTWQGEQHILGGSQDRVEPNVFMHEGRVYLAYGEFISTSNRVRRIYVTRANAPAFSSWATPVRLDAAGTSTNVDLYTPQGVVADVGAAVNEDRLAVVWSQVDGSRMDGITVVPIRTIWLAYSTDGGQTWSTPMQVNDVQQPYLAQAEDYNAATSVLSLNDNTWTLVSDAAAQGGEAMRPLPDDGDTDNSPVGDAPRLDFPFTFAATGTYTVWVRGRGANTSGNSLHVGLDGVLPSTGEQMGNLPDSYGWINTHHTSDAVRTLSVPSAGLHTVNIWMREDGSYIDAILLAQGTVPDYYNAELPVIATDGVGMVYVAWRDKTQGSARVRMRRLDMSPSTPVLEDAFWLEPAGTEQGVDDLGIAADSVGNVHVVWTDVDDNAIRVSTGIDCGAGATRSECLASFIVGSAAQQPIINPGSYSIGSAVARPSIAALDDAVIVAWEDTRSGLADIRAARADGPSFAWPTSEQRVDADGLGANLSADPHVAFGDDGRAVVTWVDLRDGERSSIYANVSLDGGLTFLDGEDAYALRVDDPATTADSITPFVLSNPSRDTGDDPPARATIVWVDFADSTNANGNEGDVYTRLLE